MAKKLPDDATLLIQYPVGRYKYARETNHIAREVSSLSHRRISLCPDTNIKSPRPIVYADMLVATALSEAAPLSAIESVLSGIPIVAANSTPFYTELINRGVPQALIELIEVPDMSTNANVLFRRQLLTERDAEKLAQSFANAVEWRMRNPLDMSEKIGEAFVAKVVGLDEESMVEAAMRVYTSDIE